MLDAQERIRLYRNPKTGTWYAIDVRSKEGCEILDTSVSISQLISQLRQQNAYKIIKYLGR